MEDKGPYQYYKKSFRSLFFLDWYLFIFATTYLPIMREKDDITVLILRISQSWKITKHIAEMKTIQTQSF